MNGIYRVYTPDNPQTAPDELIIDVQRDMWSRFVDYRNSNQWSTVAMLRSGGALRGQDFQGNPVYQSVDFYVRSTIGWHIVMADYTHICRLYGNLFDEIGGSGIFDTTRLTAQGVVPFVSGSADLITYRSAGGSGLSASEQTKLDELWKLQGLDPAAPMTVTKTSRQTGGINLDITGVENQSATVTRNDP